jgi:methyltransferase family protein
VDGSTGAEIVNWEEHKQLAASSREIIVLPWLKHALAMVEGPCIDIGCGTADITSTLATELGLSIVGIDISMSESLRAERESPRLHLVVADIAKNGILESGIIYNSAFSNCCFCHLDDEQFISVLADLFYATRAGAKFAFLVPSISWARALYSDIKYTTSGLSAVPRSGSRQYFRTPEWYMSTLQRIGFCQVTHEELLIPQDEGLAARYLSRVGYPIFSGFIAVRDEAPEDLAVRVKAFDIAHENRKLEIQLFWQRSLFFWGFVAASLVGYAQTIKDHQPYSAVFGLFGLVCSIVWSRGNRGSKYWQEYWEKKVNFLQHFATGNIFFDRKPTTPGFLDVFEGRRASVSKLTMALSDYSIGVWALLCLLTFIDKPLLDAYWRTGAATIIFLTLLFCLFFLRNAKSED